MSDVNVSRTDETSEALKTLIFFSLLMLTLPISSYFISKGFIFEGLLGMARSSSYVGAAAVAVVTVHIILGMFVYVAWKDGTKPSKKQD